MKNKWIILTLITLILSSESIFGQLWEELTTGTSYILYDISFAPGQNNVGYAVGMKYTYNANGVVIKTSDGGDTWSTILGGEGNTLDGIESVAFISPDTGFIGGWNNYFAKTTDGGTTWTTLTVGSGNWYFNDMEFWDSNNGIAVAKLNAGGSAIYVTSDGGDTWSTATGISQDVQDVTYADSLTLYAVGLDEKIYKSTDGGLTWSAIYSGTSTYYFLGVAFVDDFGVVGGEDGKMYSTTDGGNNWSSYASGYENLYGAHVFNSDSAYLGGTDENIYKTTDSGSNWTMDYNGSGSSNIYKIKYTQDNTGFACGSQGYIIRRAAPLSADFTADNTTACSGSTVNFTDLSVAATSWSWTFEGGTPSTSTDQNPSVVYNTPGVYDVSLTVSDGTDTDTETKVDYITVLETPGQANTPDGSDTVCTGNIYYYTTDAVQYAQNYDWELDPAGAGTLTWEDTLATLTAADNWTGDFTIRVRATNICGDGTWSGYFEGTVFQSPTEFTVEGGGSYCLGGDGVEITLNGSETGVSYELYQDGDPTGNTVDGTGSEISFGLITDEGYYTVYGSNGSCTQMMSDQVQVIILFPPLEPGDPTGPDTVCNNETSDYTSSGSDDADSYVWTLSPDGAGTITGTGLSATVEWSSDYSGTATVSIAGVNDCGEGNPSSMDVEVGAIPAPVITGENEVCDNSSEDYTTSDNDGSTYTWDVTGGTITDGQGTSTVTVLWGDPGTGSVTVTEESAQGCTGTSEEFPVVIDNCTGIGENRNNGELLVYPNPAQNILNVEFKAEVSGNVQVIVVNLTGQKLLQKEVDATNGKQSLRFDISGLQQGLYIIKIQSGNEVVLTRQFVKR
ncbi:MAG: T9SS type A sorting domain-containing protein [Chlorobi bacterium]|nr:T9SS type A sorting domain-containing protein [Chlorobiota bacterium]